MQRLTAVDLKLVDELTGMDSGHVLDFTNATFADFFRYEVGVDIYDDAYASGSGSKGKRLRRFLQVAQTAAVVKALHALWQYREACRTAADRGEDVKDARRRLSLVVERLGGAPLPDLEAAAVAEPEARPNDPGTPPRTVTVALEEEFLALHALEPQARGYGFEKLLTRVFDAWGMDAKGSFRVDGEQIDGAFRHHGATYLVEAKWQKAKVGATILHGFQGKVEERPLWTRGLFVSFEGFSEEGLRSFTSRRIILMDGMDVYEALRRRIPLADVVTAKEEHLSLYRKPFERVAVLFG